MAELRENARDTSWKDGVAALFMNFLEEQGISEDKYDPQFPYGGRRSTELKEYLQRSDPGNYIMGMLEWENSDEGAAYWAQMDHEWQKSLDMMNLISGGNKDQPTKDEVF